MIGTARIRGLDFYAASGDVANTSHYHSDYILSLYDIRTSNNKSGIVADSNTTTTVVQVGSSTQLAGSANSYFNYLAQINDVYNGATIKITTPILNKFVGEEFAASPGVSTDSGLYFIQCEEGNTHGGDNGIILMEEQGSANGVANVTDTRIIESYSGNSTKSYATCNTALTERTYFSAASNGTPEAGLCSTFDISFQLKDLESIAVSNTALTGGVSLRTSSADVDELSRYNGIATANAVLKDTQFNSLVFSLPDSPIKMVANTKYYHKKSVVGTASGGDVTISLSGNEKWPVAGLHTSSQAADNFTVVALGADGTNGNTTTGVHVTQGQYLSFSSADGQDRSISTSGTTGTITLNTGNTSIQVGVSYTVYSNAVTGSTRTKGLVAAKYTNNYSAAGSVSDHISNGQFLIAAPTRVVGTKTSLPVSDVFKIVKIVDSGDTTIAVTNAMMIATANDISTSYSFDTGQVDNYYGHSSITLKPGKQPPSGQLVVVYDKFSHSGVGYFSANSYDALINGGATYNGGQNSFDYTSIPSYTSPVSGETVRLSDVLDFRPIVAAGATVDVATSTASITASTITNPDADNSTTLDYSYYLPRIDKLSLTRDRTFEVIKGKSESNPVAPPDDEDSMTLYTLLIPAYTFALTDIETRYVDNKRFTMRDIGKLEKRIERLEYFTSLSVLEKETEARDISSDGSKDSLFNSTGSRFKNGILVDPFAGHSIGDVSSEDYNSAVHFAKKQLRPSFYYDNFGFNFSLTNSKNTVQTGDLITLELSPPSDTWFDQTTRPEITTNLEGHHDNWTLSGDESRKGFGSQWDDWSVNWTGKQINPEPDAAVSNGASTSTKTRSTKLIEQNKTKFGIKSDNPVETIVKSVGNKILDMSVVPFVRSQRIAFTAKGMKPLSNVYVFIGDKDMSANTEGAKKLVLSATTLKFKNGETVKDSANNRGIVRLAANTISSATTLFITDITGNTGASHSSQVTSQNNRFTNSAVGFAAANVVTGLTSGAQGTISTLVANTRGILATGISKLQTNDNGEVAGDIDVPAGTFRTGDRIIRITDHANNEIDSTTTVSETLFKAKGLLQNREKLIISTREPILRRESLGDEGIVTDTTSRQSSQSNWINPMAQSFFVEPSTYPMGMFLKDVTLYFSGKDVNLPVTVQIRPMVNGFPSSSIILPFSEVTMNPDKVQTSTTANAQSSNTSTSTTFTFDSPVYLTPDEYAITVISNSTEYKLFTAKFGDNSTGTSRKISKQPFVGSFYRPQNAGAWKAMGEEFLMMKINRCNFTGTGGNNNYAKFESHANGASGNTANVKFETFKTTLSTIQFSNTTTEFRYNSANTANAFVGFTEFSTEQNITLANTRMMTSSTNGMFAINCTMSTSNSHVSPVIDIDRLSVITIENDIDNAVISANDITVTTRGTGFTNTAPNAFKATISAPDLGSNTATANVHVEVTLTLSDAATNHLQSANGSYTVSGTNAGQFVIGEGVRTVVSSADGGAAVGLTSGTQTTATASGTAPTHLVNAAVGIVSSQTFVGGDPTKNTSTVTIKTSANNFGVFANGTYIVADTVAQAAAMTNSGKGGSNTFAVIVGSGGVTGQVSNVVPWPAGGTAVGSSGSGYLNSPTVTITANTNDSFVTGASAIITGEDSATGGNINTKYISRRVTLEDGFDASDLKVIVNAYKPIGTGINIYYKVKADEDQDDFDTKGYVLMSQETSNSVYSLSPEDTKEFVYQTSTDSIDYTSSNVNYSKFKTFSIKIVLTSETASTVPKVRDMRAIALDT
jgi:hypothetical protein